MQRYPLASYGHRIIAHLTKTRSCGFMRAKETRHESSRGAADMPVMELDDTRFTRVGEGMLDNRARLALTKVLEVLRERFGKDAEPQRLHFTIHCNSAGAVLLV